MDDDAIDAIITTLMDIALEKLEKPQISEAFIRYWLYSLRKLDMSKKEHRQMLIDGFINAIFLYDDRMLITFNYKEDTKTITFEDVKNEVSANSTGSALDCKSAPNNKREAFASLLLFLQGLQDSNRSKCGADERRRRGLDRANH